MDKCNLGYMAYLLLINTFLSVINLVCNIEAIFMCFMDFILTGDFSNLMLDLVKDNM